MTDRELLQQTLDLLNQINQCSLPPIGIPLPAEIDDVMEAIKARLAQPEPKPVAWRYKITPPYWTYSDHEPNQKFAGSALNSCQAQPLYTAPPRREWVGLTDDEYELMAEKRVTNYFFNTLDYAHDIEAMLKEKNT